MFGFGDDKVLTQMVVLPLERFMARQWFAEALIDLQTIVIVVLLYDLLREEQANPFLRTWLSENFPLGLYLLAPVTVAAISTALLIMTAVRIVSFVTGRNFASGSREVLHGLGALRKPLGEFAATRATSFSAVVLVLFGVGLVLYSSLVIIVVPFTALGVSCIILGFTMISLPRHQDGGPAMKAMLQGAILGVEALLEQSSPGRATYLPPDQDGVVSAYVPLSREEQRLSLEEMKQAPRALVAKGQKGVLIYPIGSELNKIHQFQNFPSLEERLRYVLVESANVCSRVIAEQAGSVVIVGMKVTEIDMQRERYRNSLGSLPLSLAACVIAAFHNKPVTLIEERKTGDRLIARFMLLA